jgi:hypothetical protein
MPPGTKGLFVETNDEGTRLVVVFQEWGRQGELVIPLTPKKMLQLITALQQGALIAKGRKP